MEPATSRRLKSALIVGLVIVSVSWAFAIFNYIAWLGVVKQYLLLFDYKTNKSIYVWTNRLIFYPRISDRLMFTIFRTGVEEHLLALSQLAIGIGINGLIGAVAGWFLGDRPWLSKIRFKSLVSIFLIVVIALISATCWVHARAKVWRELSVRLYGDLR